MQACLLCACMVYINANRHVWDLCKKVAAQQQLPIDTLQLIQFLEDRRREDEDRCHEDEDRRRTDKAEGRRVEDAQRREEFCELLAAITGQQLTATPVTITSTQSPMQGSPPHPSQPHHPLSTKAFIQPPPPLLPDVNLQAFWEWRRK